MNVKKINLLFHTLKFLKFKQIYYRFYYLLRKKLFKPKYTKGLSQSINLITWRDNNPYSNSYLLNNAFIFLNIRHQFKDVIDWNLSTYGKLWTYNLTYFDFLNQQNIELIAGQKLIENYIENSKKIKDGNEPYPTSLRGINWIKFLSKHKIKNAVINQNLYNQYQNLINNLEYHLLGNHLLENGYSLFFGAYYFQDNKLYSIAVQVLKDELSEQILSDGAHFELSPMYHQILLHRLLDCINLTHENDWNRDEELISFLEKKATEMLSWLETVTYRNGEIPMVNDSAFDIAISTKKLFLYAKELNIVWQKTKLTTSGYRKIDTNKGELFFDVGDVKATYIAGHTHADTLSFELYMNGRPILVDPGISTYESNQIRANERSTSWHNTVTVDGLNSSQVWAGFRVGNRAKIDVLIDTAEKVSAVHDGYKKLKIQHKRTVSRENEEFVIEDFVEGVATNIAAHFHFHPACEIEISKEMNSVVTKKVECHFEGSQSFKVEKYNYALGFNKTISAKKIVVSFSEKLVTRIKCKT